MVDSAAAPLESEDSTSERQVSQLQLQEHPLPNDSSQSVDEPPVSDAASNGSSSTVRPLLVFRSIGYGLRSLRFWRGRPVTQVALVTATGQLDTNQDSNARVVEWLRSVSAAHYARQHLQMTFTAEDVPVGQQVDREVRRQQRERRRPRSVHQGNLLPTPNMANKLH